MRRIVGLFFVVFVAAVGVDLDARVTDALTLQARDPRVIPPAKPSEEERIVRHRSSATVPSRDFQTIQSAIDAVEDGGSIFVKSGVYHEQLAIRGKRIRLTGAGADGPGRTEIVGEPSTAVDEHTRAVGLINYVDGGGGVIAGFALRGGMNGIVGRGAAAVDSDATSTHGLTVRAMAISNTGRGILWDAPASLTIHDVVARHLRHNGVVFAPAGVVAHTAPALNILKLDISDVGGYGVLVMDTPSIGCQNQLTNVFVTLAAFGGIGVIRSGVCISDGALSLNHVSGIYLQESAAIIDGTKIQSSIATASGFLGDGVVAMASEVKLTHALLNSNDRAGISNFGGSATLTWNTFNCNTFDLNGEILAAGYFGASEPPTDLDWEFHDAIPGSNTCGCGAQAYACAAVSSQLQTPSPTVIEQ